MAQMERVLNSSQETKNLIFGMCHDPYFLEVRFHIASWLEEYILNCNLDWENEIHHQPILQRMAELCQALGAKANEISSQDKSSYIPVLRLQQAAYTIWNGTPKSRIELFGYIKNCLLTEQNLLPKQQQSDSTSKECCGNPVVDLMEESAKELNIKLGQISHTADEITSAQEKFATEVQQDEYLANCIEHGVGDLPAAIGNLTLDVPEMFAYKKSQIDRTILQLVSSIMEKKQIFESQQNQLLSRVSEFQNKLLEEISKWNRQSFINVQFVPLEILQKWMLMLARVLFQTRKQFRDVENVLQQCCSLSNLGGTKYAPIAMNQIFSPEAEIKRLLAELIRSSLAVETQPGPIIKKNRLFNATLRFLIGSLPEFSKDPQDVTTSVSILNEAEAKEFQSKNGKAKLDPSCEIINKLKNGKGKGTNNKGQLTVTKTIVRAEFKKLEVTKVIHKCVNKDAVPDERFWLLFQTELTFDNQKFKIWTFSSPLRVNSHGNQEEESMSSIIWDIAAGDTGSTFPTTPRPRILPIPNLCLAISALFISMTQREPSPHNLEVISEKMQGLSRGSSTPQNQISLIEFREKILPETDFTFWNWLYAIIKLTANYLCGDENSKGPWQDGLIVGFTRSKKETEEWMTQNTIRGTFLLRFSDTSLGSISVCMRDVNKAWSVEPFDSKALTVKSLAGRILSIAELWFLYPSTPKDQAFSKYLPKSDKETNGAPRKLSARQYVYTVLMDQILLPSITPGCSKNSSLSELPKFLYQDHGQNTDMDTELSPELEKIIEDEVENFYQRSVEPSGSISTGATSGEDGYNSVDSAELSPDDTEVSRC